PIDQRDDVIGHGQRLVADHQVRGLLSAEQRVLERDSNAAKFLVIAGLNLDGWSGAAITDQFLQVIQDHSDVPHGLLPEHRRMWALYDLAERRHG
ncbi:hypothetical protein JTM76_35990, partial [Pseudomonas aeruginosa]|nr:hypothetical protein [Pseudomonas aeruginosa]